MLVRVRTFSFVALLLMLFSGFSSVSAQTRISDNDLERLMQNLKDDAKSFQPVFESSLKHSSIRKTSREKDAKSLAQRFTKQTEGAWKQYRKTHKNDVGMPEVAATAQEIDRLVSDLKLNGETVSAWTKIRAELNQVEDAFGIKNTPGSAGSLSSAASGVSCRQAVGEERAQRLVEECTHVSTATHPPCNAENSCTLIIDEIKRGCGLLGRDAPQYCMEYK